ncbi:MULTISPECIES: hypothetical protein [Burkholderia]|uniref:Uncharacterized protein n=1 Tax=Burkholderia aenigmatica TaxID=2015348 RepID=A0A6J5JKN1_9BURK|nr:MULTISPECIES: hypothetical protein [Burkholderia]CAB3972626.1 hypothetical protein BLA3211_07063 [Burkholderia aenigmatica]
MTTLDAIRWEQNYADVQTSLHHPRIRAFLGDVALPALGAIDRDIERWGKTREGGAPFARADAEALLQATIQAFCLAIQSIWERQLRVWMCDCVHYCGGDAQQVRLAQQAPLEQVSRLLLDLRGAALAAFPSYPDLEYLQLVGNACRHGDGRSSDALFRAHRELWPTWTSAPFPWPAENPPMGPPAIPSFRHAVLPRELLTRFVNAIGWFWEDVSYVCMNGFVQKDEGIESRLAELRTARAARPMNEDTQCAADPAG